MSGTVITNRTLRESKKTERNLRRQLGDVGAEITLRWRALAPWMLLVTAIGGANVAHWLAAWGDVETFSAVCITLAGVAMLATSVHLTKRRLRLGRVHEWFNVSAPVAVIAYTVEWGPNKYVLIGAGIFGAASAIIWNRRHTSTALRELEQMANGNDAGGIPQRWRAFTAEHMPTLADSSMVVMKDTPEEFVAGIDLGDAGVPSDVGPILERFTRFAGGIAGGAALIPGEYLDKVAIRVMRKDPLKKPFPWQGPSAPGESIVEPIEGLGRYRDGADLALILPHVAAKSLDEDDKPQSHMMMIGMSRAGKGEAGEEIDTCVATRRDAIVVLCDPVKADQQLGAISQGADYVLDTPSKIRAFFHRLVNGTIPARSAYLGNPTRNLLRKVCKEWEPGCGLSWVLVHVYEAAALYNNQDLTKLTERAAGVGIQIIIEAQKGIHDRVDVNARSNAADLILFGTFDFDDASLVLPAELVDLGVNPSVWKNKQAGMCYVVLSHLPLARQAMPARFARKNPDGSDITAALNEYMHLAQPCDPITAATWGEPYEKYRAEVDAKRGRRTKQFAGAVLLDNTPERGPARIELPAAPVAQARRAYAVPADEGFDLGEDDEAEPTPDDEYAEVVESAEKIVGDMVNTLGDDPEAQDVLDLAYDGLEAYGRDGDQPNGLPVPRPDDFEFPDDPDEAAFEVIPNRDEALDVLLDVLRVDVGEGNRFKPSHLYDALDRRAKRSDSWVRRCMKILTGWGCIQESEEYGVYEVVHTQRGDLDGYRESPEEEL